MLPCPFCGGLAGRERTRNGYLSAATRERPPLEHWIKCGSCGTTTAAFVSEASAQDAWNSRIAAQPPVETTTTALEPPPIHTLEGPIEVGQRFIWGPHNGRAWAHIEVTRVQSVRNDETRIWTKCLRGNHPKTEVWNDESRFREACVRAPEEPSSNCAYTYDVVAYNASWNGYGDNASREGFKTAEEAIAYAKSCAPHLDAMAFKRTIPIPVERISIQIYPPENGTPEQL